MSQVHDRLPAASPAVGAPEHAAPAASGTDQDTVGNAALQSRIGSGGSEVCEEPTASEAAPVSEAPAAAAPPPAPQAFQDAVRAGDVPAANAAWAAMTGGERASVEGDGGLFVAYLKLLAPADAAGKASAASALGQLAVASDTGLVSALSAGVWVLQLLPALRTAPQLVTLAANTPFLALLLIDLAGLGAVIAGVGADPWVGVLRGAGKDAEILKLAAAAPAVWAPAVKSAGCFDAILGGVATPVPGDLAPGVWALWEGQSYARASSELAFNKLYNTTVQGAGGVFTNPTSSMTVASGTWDVQGRFSLVTVDDATYNDFMAMVKPLPAAHLRAADIGFAGAFETWARQTALPAGSPGAPGMTWILDSTAPLTTSYYSFGGDIVYRAVNTAAAGATPAWSGNTSVGTDAPGEVISNHAGAPLMVNNDGHGGALSVFQNHARHEIGHAVGAKALPGIGAGNQMARDWAGWAPTTKDALADGYWSNAAGKATVSFGGTDTEYDKSALKAWCASIVDGTVPSLPDPITAHAAGDVPGMLAAIDAACPSQNLSTYAEIVKRLGAGYGYILEGITPPDPVPFRCTRSTAPYMSYSKAAFDALKSTYGWYSLSSPKEMFAEMYTMKYSAGLSLPASAGGVDPVSWFAQLEQVPDAVFGAAAAEPGGLMGADPGVGASDASATAELDEPAATDHAASTEPPHVSAPIGTAIA